MSNQQKTKMKTIYLREKRSGNYEFSNRKKATLKFTTKKALREFWENKIDGQSKYLRYKQTKKGAINYSAFPFESPKTKNK